jgi:hypothetical protein
MWNPASPTRSALTLLMAAAVAFLGSAMVLKAGRAFPELTGGGAPGAGQPGILLLAVVILLAVSGVLLVGMAGKEVLDLRRRPHAR